jgi:hypothetical protein
VLSKSGASGLGNVVLQGLGNLDLGLAETRIYELEYCEAAVFNGIDVLRIRSCKTCQALIYKSVWFFGLFLTQQRVDACLLGCWRNLCYLSALIFVKFGHDGHSSVTFPLSFSEVRA